MDLSNLKNSNIKILENFTKNGFNLEGILDSAEALKYIKLIKNEYEKELTEPSDEFVKLLVSRFFDKPLTANRMVTFKEYTKKALSNSINETISSRLKNALNMNETIPSIEEDKIEPIDDNNGDSNKIETTEEELEGFHIVKAILRKKLPAERIAHRDTQSYFGILLDNNNRKPLCRLHFNSSYKYLELFHKGKDNGERILLNSLEDIYNHSNELVETINLYE